ncbi:lysylphosphatidylglycerol synthase transmembrane domain-containing protein [Paenibacillus sp. FSL R7-0297]|uniref:lysylphosphatidylglycerol synthase transmembrane domain-containing protein n=1 Tax=Paenibacillus sp. FSL R7-0297 TaxID=2921680 RepID=UPI0030FBE50A
MSILLFLSAIILLMLGHYFKMLRWKQFVEIYETPSEGVLLRSLSLGYMVNFCLPFRLGDLIRIIFSGRKMKNGVAFSLSTVFVDRYLDVLVVSIIFSLFTLIGINNPLILDSTIFYVVLAVVLIVLSALAMKYSRLLKIAVKKVCSIFNIRIELKMLFVCWSIITSFKDIFRKIDKRRLTLYTVCIWGAYLASYYTLGMFLSGEMNVSGFSDIFTTLFSHGSLDSGTVDLTYSIQAMSIKPQTLLAVYLIVPLLALWLLSFLPYRFKKAVLQYTNNGTNPSKALNLLPQVNEDDRLNFLEAYFSGNGRAYLEKYLEINQRISIIQDYSAGSNATVMLCMDENRSFYRKYAFGEDGDKLYQQVQWLRQYEGVLPLPLILNEQHGDGYCSFDMEYSTTSVGFFNYIHSRPIAKSREIIRRALDSLADNLYKGNQRPAEPALISKYIRGKVSANLEKIKNAREIKSIYEFQTLLINGQEYMNLSVLESYLEEEYLYNVFKDDIYSEIHGDLTIENIICVDDVESERGFYLIDPNTGNVHDSPYLDYAKLLQSLHGGYEFLMKTQNVTVTKNRIDFLLTRSQSYNEMFSFYVTYLNERFTKKQVKSIFFHEVVHWLRLLPYKIEKNGKRAILFYAGLVMVINDVINWYENASANHTSTIDRVEEFVASTTELI